MGAGLEHFGRGVGISANGVVIVIDPNSTSLLFAKAARDMVEGIKRRCLVIDATNRRPHE